MVQCLPSKIKNPEAHFLLPCEFPGCSKKCANKGAVANHMRFAHGNRIAVESISSFVIRKPPKIIDCFKSLAISTLAMHLVSNASNLGPVPYLRPILRPFIHLLHTMRMRMNILSFLLQFQNPQQNLLQTLNLRMAM